MMQNEKIGPVERPVVRAAFEKQKASQKFRNGLFWGTVNLVVVVVIVSEILYGSIFEDLDMYGPIILYIEIAVAGWCTLRLLSELLFCLQWLLENPVILTHKQYQLLAVHPRDKGFTPVQDKLTQHNDQLAETGPYMTTSLSPVIPISSPSGVVTPGSQRSSPIMTGSSFDSFYTTNTRMSVGYFSPSYQEIPSQVYYSPSSGNVTLRNRFLGSHDSPYSPTNFSPVHYNDVTMSPDCSNVSRYPSPSSSPFSDDRIRSVNALNSYLQNQEDKNDLLHMHRDGYSTMIGTSGYMNTSPTSEPHHWSPYCSQMEYSTPLNVYKIGTRSPLSSTSKDEDEYGHMSPQAEELWLKFGASRQKLDFWTENLRKWISQTILCRLVKQIDGINATLQRIGSSELQIGMISLGSLRQVSTSKGEHVPNLVTVLPYLELSNNQEYLVKRIRELGKDSCMGVYRWKLGSDYRGRVWDQDLPTDAQIVMHVFCTYMDSRLPTDARFPDGRTFTGLYFLKNLDKPESKKRDLAIHRFRQNPPHFKVIVGDDVFDVGKGRNNLFHSIILFLLMVKTKHHGMLGRVNLGPSGVNILGIFGKR